MISDDPEPFHDRPRHDTSSRHKPDPCNVIERMIRTMRSEKAMFFSDVTLISSDGDKIPAIRALLAMNSPYFEKLFSSKFFDKSRAVFNVSVPAVQLQRVLGFLYTDDCPILHEICPYFTGSRIVECKLIATVVELGHAAEQLGVRRLLSWVVRALDQLILVSADSHGMCLIWQELSKSRTSWGDVLKDRAGFLMADNHYIPLLAGGKRCQIPCGVLHFSGKVLGEVLKELLGKHLHNEALRFQVLMVWASGGKGLFMDWKERLKSEPFIILDGHNMKIPKSRLPIARRLAKGFDLSETSLTFVTEVVENSGLLDINVISDVCKELANREKETGKKQTVKYKQEPSEKREKTERES